MKKRKGVNIIQLFRMFRKMKIGLFLFLFAFLKFKLRIFLLKVE